MPSATANTRSVSLLATRLHALPHPRTYKPPFTTRPNTIPTTKRESVPGTPSTNLTALCPRQHTQYFATHASESV